LTYYNYLHLTCFHMLVNIGAQASHHTDSYANSDGDIKIWPVQYLIYVEQNRGIVITLLCLFICLFATLWENYSNHLYQIVPTDRPRPWDEPITFWVTKSTIFLSLIIEQFSKIHKKCKTTPISLQFDPPVA
uniref:Uncharacterized protein n=1 Tax=Sphaeramia orbicularis TaxID=375764 RepID=A0A672YTT0_9TELE